MNVNEILFRASSTGDLMTAGDGEITEIQLAKLSELQNRQSKAALGQDKPLTDNMREELTKLIYKRDNPTLSLTCQKRLIKVYAFEMYGRTEDISSKYMEKGTMVEEDAITLFSRVKKKAFKKNEVRLSNKYITGLPDLWDGEGATIYDAEEIEDIKSSWSLITFLNAKVDKKINHDYKWQGNSYLGLVPKAKRFRLAYCLVNSPAKLITDEKFKAQRELGFLDQEMADSDPSFIERCKAIERNHIFDLGLFKEHYPHFDFHNEPAEWSWDIPKEKRVHEFVFDRNEAEISQLYKRVPECRKWISETFLK